jgi:hypothetical protein
VGSAIEAGVAVQVEIVSHRLCRQDFSVTDACVAAGVVLVPGNAVRGGVNQFGVGGARGPCGCVLALLGPSLVAVWITECGVK